MSNPLKAILFGLLSALFFSATYILNKSMASAGGDFLWSACLRYIITLPIILMIALLSKGGKTLFKAVFNNPLPWLLWGSVGFGFFYIALTAAASFSPAWLVAGTFQTTIIAGLLLSPFIYKDERKIIPKKAFIATCIILLGVIISQIGEVKSSSLFHIIIGALLVIFSAFMFPLGNRMILLFQEKEHIKLNAIQRVAGMTLGSMPLWIIVAAIAYFRSGAPSSSEVLQSGVIALSSGVIATVLFFKATEMAGSNTSILGAVEATQSAEIGITLMLELLFLNGRAPSALSILGMILITLGMLYYTKISSAKSH